MTGIKPGIFIFIFLNLIFFSGPGISQTISPKNTCSKIDTDSLLEIIDSLKDSSPSLEIGNEFTNKVVFWGRDYGENQYGFQPYITYKTGKGLYIYGSQYYWSKSDKPWAKTDLGVGYEKQLTDRFYASLAYERWIFYNGTRDERNRLQNYFELEFNYDLGYFSVEPTVYYMVGNKQIFQTDLVISGDYKLFNFKKTGRVFLQPELMMTNATSTILTYNIGNSNKQQDLPRGFNVVDYELLVPFNFKYKNIEFKPAYHFAYPIAYNKSENLHPFSYYTVTLSYAIFFNKGKIRRLYTNY